MGPKQEDAFVGTPLVILLLERMAGIRRGNGR
jgi:hypothetical protein